VQRLREQRVRPENIGEFGPGAAVHDPLSYPADQGAVRAGEQRDDHGVGAVGRRGGARLLPPLQGREFGRSRGAFDTLGGRGGQHRPQRGVFLAVSVHVTDARVQAGQLGAGDAHDLLDQTARVGAGGARHGEHQRRCAVRSSRWLRTAVPPWLAGTRHSYGQAGCGTCGVAHGAAC
jgi:hypothetical protein